jgi:uncharacterized membrane protein
MKILTQKYWHELFEFGVLLKSINGIWETFSGFIFLFLSKVTLESWFFVVTKHELLEDPKDPFISFLAQTFQNISRDTQLFAAIYLIMHGFLNIFLAIQLQRDKHWAYLATIGFTLLFVVYQIYRINMYHSLFLTVVTIFDLFFAGLAFHEYKYHKEKSFS